MKVIAEFLFVGLFLGWLGLTVAFQFRHLQMRMRLKDPLFILPSWSFFAPIPNTSDFVFVLRYESNGEMTPWRQPSLFSPKRLTFLWDPERRQRKVIIDISQCIAEFVRSGQSELIHFTVPYLLLLQYASAQPEAMFATGVQVAIGVRPAQKNDFELFFQSHVHLLDPIARSSHG